ncbi:hypothetical protein GCM10009844_05130 [Nocardioides koreensis]|uniref:DUF4345 domain-containing protein n=1 Tax=Nocardioides koreensis TaxID=433651 RepID=A0ABN2Z701_9ACTN
MTSEPIGKGHGGRHAAATPGKAVEVPSTTFHYHDRERLASYRRTEPYPPMARAGAWLVLLVGLSVMYAEWDLYGQSAQNQSDANWALGFMILSTAGALRILVGAPGRHLPAGVAILVSGLGFLYRAFLVTGDASAVLAYEATCGVLLVVAALMVLLSPDLTGPPPPSSDPWG